MGESLLTLEQKDTFLIESVYCCTHVRRYARVSDKESHSLIHAQVQWTIPFLKCVHGCVCRGVDAGVCTRACGLQ